MWTTKMDAIIRITNIKQKESHYIHVIGLDYKPPLDRLSVRNNLLVSFRRIFGRRYKVAVLFDDECKECGTFKPNGRCISNNCFLSKVVSKPE